MKNQIRKILEDLVEDARHSWASHSDEEIGFQNYTDKLNILLSPKNETIIISKPPSNDDYDFNIHQHWRNERDSDDDYGGTIKHFQ